MLDAVKERVIAEAPWSLVRERPAAEVSWARVLLSWLTYEALIAAGRAVALVILVWLVRRYWWHGLPSLSYLPAVGIVLLARTVMPVALGNVTEVRTPRNWPAAGDREGRATAYEKLLDAGFPLLPDDKPYHNPPDLRPALAAFQRAAEPARLRAPTPVATGITELLDAADRRVTASGDGGAAKRAFAAQFDTVRELMHADLQPKP